VKDVGLAVKTIRHVIVRNLRKKKMKCPRCGKFNFDEKFCQMDLDFVVGAGRSYTRMKYPNCFQTLS
jgi:hypothetical protein